MTQREIGEGASPADLRATEALPGEPDRASDLLLLA